jgi:hypothetical protein
MKIFKDRTAPWWETGLIKWSSILFGIAIGSYWSNIFLPYIFYITIIAIIFGIVAFVFWSKE